MSDTPFILDPYIAKIPDFPKTGITFYDISPALEDAYAFSQMTRRFVKKRGPIHLICLLVSMPVAFYLAPLLLLPLNAVS